MKDGSIGEDQEEKKRPGKSRGPEEGDDQLFPSRYKTERLFSFSGELHLWIGILLSHWLI